MNSIRREISVRLLAGACLLLVSAGLVLGWFIHARLLALFDHTLEAKARALGALTSIEGKYLEFDFADEHMPEFSDEEEPEYFQLRLRGTRVIARSESLEEEDLLPGPEADGVRAFHNLRLPDGRRGRIVHLTVHPRREIEEEELEDAEDIAATLTSAASAAGVFVTIAVARSRDELDALLWSLYGTLAGMVVLVLGGIVLLVRHAVSRGLQPVADINAQVAAIGPDALDRRVQLTAPPAELRAIPQTINALLGRLQHAFERERRFSSNVAHELRTPVAELRAASEVGERWPDDPEETRRLFHDVREIALQMETIVSHMLLLSRCENRSEAVTRTAVRLESVVRTCWEHNAATAVARGVQFDARVDPAGTVETDNEKLGMIVQNLLENAVSHGAPSGTVRCFTAGRPDGLDLVIENDAADVTPEDVQHVFEPFWRKDPARRASNHAGLGLSIVKALCDLLGIGLRIEIAGGRLFVVRLSFAEMAVR